MDTYKSRSDVVAHLNKLVDSGYLQSHSNGWSSLGLYCLSHGEYDRPDFRPARYKDGWGIAMVSFYYDGTLYAPTPRKRVNLDVSFDVSSGFLSISSDDFC